MSWFSCQQGEFKVIFINEFCFSLYSYIPQHSIPVFLMISIWHHPVSETWYDYPTPSFILLNSSQQKYQNCPLLKLWGFSAHHEVPIFCIQINLREIPRFFQENSFAEWKTTEGRQHEYTPSLAAANRKLGVREQNLAQEENINVYTNSV